MEKASNGKSLVDALLAAGEPEKDRGAESACELLWKLKWTVNCVRTQSNAVSPFRTTVTAEGGGKKERGDLTRTHWQWQWDIREVPAPALPPVITDC